MFKIIGITDRFDPRLTEFRKRVCIENGAHETYLDLDIDKESTLEYCKPLGSNCTFEEIWKYGNNKWTRTEFARIECLLEGDEIISISGSRFYTHNLLRVGMHLYTLKSHRKSYRNVPFSENGFFYHHLQFAKNHPFLDALFLSIYPHNPKLMALVKNIAHRQMSPDGGKENLHFVDKMVFIENPITFHDVNQYFFYYPLRELTEFPTKNVKPMKVLIS